MCHFSDFRKLHLYFTTLFRKNQHNFFTYPKFALRKESMYEIFQKLLKNTGLKTADVVKATGISASTFTDWKMGRSTPKQDKMQKVADFFGVSLNYLMTGTKTRDKFLDYQGQTELWLKIRHDDKMLDALEKFYNLSETQKEHIFELIDLLGKASK